MSHGKRADNVMVERHAYGHHNFVNTAGRRSTATVTSCLVCYQQRRQGDNPVSSRISPDDDGYKAKGHDATGTLLSCLAHL